jgi:PleD family two-component response regulator
MRTAAEIGQSLPADRGNLHEGAPSPAESAQPAGASAAPKRLVRPGAQIPERDLLREWSKFMGVAEAHAPGPPVTVFLLDDQTVARVGVRKLLDSEPDMEVVGEAGTCAEALAKVPELSPQVLMLEGRLPDGDGVTVWRALRARMPELVCLIFSLVDDDTVMLEAAMAGVSGYVLKQANGGELVHAVRTVASGHSMLGPATLRRLLERVGNRDASEVRT